jgi:hypothetical protein
MVAFGQPRLGLSFGDRFPNVTFGHPANGVIRASAALRMFIGGQGTKEGGYGCAATLPQSVDQRNAKARPQFRCD